MKIWLLKCLNNLCRQPETKVRHLRPKALEQSGGPDLVPNPREATAPTRLMLGKMSLVNIVHHGSRAPDILFPKGTSPEDAWMHTEAAGGHPSPCNNEK